MSGQLDTFIAYVSINISRERERKKGEKDVGSDGDYIYAARVHHCLIDYVVYIC